MHTVAVSAPEPGPPASTPERLVLFTDAVAAIALTLLILPLLELIPEASAGGTVGDLIREHRGEFGAFVLSFAVIFRFWWAHHRVFRHIARLRPALVGLSALWTFAIVFLPIPTAIITAYRPSVTSVALYGGTLVLASGSMTLLALYAYRHPELSEDRAPATREEVLGSAAVFVSQLLATVVGARFAGTVNYWAFLLLFLTGPVERAIKRRWRTP